MTTAQQDDTTTTHNLVLNPSFEEDFVEASGWVIGKADADNDTWAFDTEITKDSGRSLRLEPRLQCVATQVLRGPLEELEGKRVDVSVDIRQVKAAANPTVMLIAFNPDLPKDELLQTGVAGKTQITAPGGRDGRFVRYSGSFVATGPATSLQIMLLASGHGGQVWFDNAEVTVTG